MNCICMHIYMGFPSGSVDKELTFNALFAGDTSSIPGLGRAPGGGHGNPLQYSCLEKSEGLYSPWGCKKLDTTQVTEHTRMHIYTYYIQLNIYVMKYIYTHIYV